MSEEVVNDGMGTVAATSDAASHYIQDVNRSVATLEADPDTNSIAAGSDVATLSLLGDIAQWANIVALEQSPASIVITDTRGAIEYVNPHFQRITGYSAAEVLGQNPRVLKSGYTSDEQYKVLWEQISQGEVWRGEFHNRRKNGELYWESATISPIRDSDGIIRHFIAVKEDNTDKKRWELELIAAKERAERSDRLKDAFIMNISHEVRTPLNVILGYTELLGMEVGPVLAADQAEYFQHIVRAGKRLQRTIENILYIATLEVGEPIFERQPVDLISELFTLVTDMRLLALEKQLILEFQNDIDTAWILADPITLRDALANVIDNAIKFTDEGGVVVQAFREDGAICISVKDTGIGISEEYAQSLFSTFSQEEVGTTRRFEGLGLGMALTKKYLDINGATIRVESVKSVGTTFWIRFTEALAPFDVFDQSTAVNWAKI
ncbi:MAG: PAS domain S-box protein [Ignavibacteriae bacterium]|nr:PAS domain S-box protein [Ignavibacteriota bacterium]